MTSVALIVAIVLALTLLGTIALAAVTLKYYWGDRGSPPPTGEARLRQKEEELRRRARQIKRAERSPVTPRNIDFWDNRKVHIKDDAH